MAREKRMLKAHNHSEKGSSGAFAACSCFNLSRIDVVAVKHALPFNGVRSSQINVGPISSIDGRMSIYGFQNDELEFFSWINSFAIAMYSFSVSDTPSRATAWSFVKHSRRGTRMSSVSCVMPRRASKPRPEASLSLFSSTVAVARANLRSVRANF